MVLAGYSERLGFQLRAFHYGFGGGRRGHVGRSQRTEQIRVHRAGRGGVDAGFRSPSGVGRRYHPVVLDTASDGSPSCNIWSDVVRGYSVHRVVDTHYGARSGEHAGDGSHRHSIKRESVEPIDHDDLGRHRGYETVVSSKERADGGSRACGTYDAVLQERGVLARFRGRGVYQSSESGEHGYGELGLCLVGVLRVRNGGDQFGGGRPVLQSGLGAAIHDRTRIRPCVRM